MSGFSSSSHKLEVLQAPISSNFVDIPSLSSIFMETTSNYTLNIYWGVFGGVVVTYDSKFLGTVLFE